MLASDLIIEFSFLSVYLWCVCVLVGGGGVGEKPFQCYEGLLRADFCYK